MLLIAHRGDTVNYPENTMEAFGSALASGADGIEFDVHVIDNEAVVVHNYLSRPPGPYPTLRAVLEEFGGKTHLELEVKSYRKEDIAVIIDTLRDAMPPDIEITSGIFPVIPYLRTAFPHTDIGAIFKKSFVEDYMTDAFLADLMAGQMEDMGATVIHLPPQIYSPDVIAPLKKRYIVHHHLWTNDPAEYDRLETLGMDRATVNDIRLIRTIRQQKG